MAGFGRRMRQFLLAQVGGGSWAGLSAADPGDAAAFLAEPTIGVNGYARRAVTWGGIPLPTSGDPAILSNSNIITFTSSGIWNATQALAYVTVWTAATGTAESVFVGTCALAPARLIDRAGIVVTIPAGALQLSIGLKE